MKKEEKSSGNKHGLKTSNPQKVNEPMPAYKTVKVFSNVKDFTFEEFKKVADKTPFTLAEWAAILHVSERTLQRYAKNNGKFARSIMCCPAVKRFLVKQPISMNGSIQIHLAWKASCLFHRLLHMMAFKKY
jgi:DNA-binding transcriptional regulator YiaG